jgi:hypothetical protein
MTTSCDLDSQRRHFILGEAMYPMLVNDGA